MQTTQIITRSAHVQNHEMFGNESAEEPMAETVAPTSDRMFDKKRIYLTLNQHIHEK